MSANPTPELAPPNGMATTGFILAFFTLIPFVGFAIFVLSVTFCAIGWRRANLHGLQGKGLAIAGMIVNIATLIFSILIVAAIMSAAASV